MAREDYAGWRAGREGSLQRRKRVLREKEKERERDRDWGYRVSPTSSGSGSGSGLGFGRVGKRRQRSRRRRSSSRSGRGANGHAAATIVPPPAAGGHPALRRQNAVKAKRHGPAAGVQGHGHGHGQGPPRIPPRTSSWRQNYPYPGTNNQNHNGPTYWREDAPEPEEDLGLQNWRSRILNLRIQQPNDDQSASTNSSVQETPVDAYEHGYGYGYAWPAPPESHSSEYLRLYQQAADGYYDGAGYGYSYGGQGAIPENPGEETAVEESAGENPFARFSGNWSQPGGYAYDGRGYDSMDVDEEDEGPDPTEYAYNPRAERRAAATLGETDEEHDGQPWQGHRPPQPSRRAKSKKLHTVWD